MKKAEVFNCILPEYAVYSLYKDQTNPSDK